MRYHFWTDAAGYQRRVLLRDADAADEHIGIPVDPPDLAGLGELTDDMQRDLHNMLAGRGLFTWQDVTAQGNGVTAAIAQLVQKYKLDGAALKRELVRRYRGR
jgi:hypothetical protein